MKRSLVITVILAVTALMAFVGYFVGSYEDEPIAAAFGFGFMTFLVVGGITYLVHYTRSMSKVDIPDFELEGKEVVWAKTAQSMVHYRTGNALKFWDAVGGRLFLTNQFLEFR